jgi:gliding motility-associated-like protein
VKIKKTKELNPEKQQQVLPVFLSFKSVTLLVLFFMFLGELYSQNPNLQFAFNVGGAYASGVSVVLDQQGNVYSTGIFYGTADFDPGPSVANLTATSSSGSLFIAKYSSTGAYQWAFNVSGGSSKGSSIFVDASSNIYVTGYFLGVSDFNPGLGTANLVSNGSTDIFVAKYNSSGIYQWAFNIGGASQDNSTSVKVDAAGNVFLTGYFGGTVDFDPSSGVSNISSLGIYDGFVAKYNAVGSYQWAINIGTPSLPNTANSISIDGASNVYVTGSFYGTVDFDPGPGVANLQANGGTNDIFVAKYNTAGVYQWAFNIGGPTSDVGYSIVTDMSGNVYLGGYFQNFPDFDPGPGSTNLLGPGAFLAKYDVGGNFKWALPIRNTGSGGVINIVRSISTDNLGNVFITGHFSNTADFDPSPGTAILTGSVEPDIFVAKYDASGVYKWAFSVGDVNDDVGSSIVADNWGNIFVTGYFWGITDFDPTVGVTNLSSHNGNFDLFLAKYSPCPSLAAPASIGGNSSVCAGSTNNYSISPVAGAVSYTWTLPSGWTGSSTGTSINCTAGNNGGVILVVANNNCGPASSQSLNVTVKPIITPNAVISANPSRPVCPGTSVKFTATASNFGSGTISNYDFKVNGISQQSGPSNTYATVSLANTDVVSCIISFTGGTCFASSAIVSNNIITALNPIPSISFDPANPTIIAGNSVRLNARVTGNIASYLWTPATGLDNPSIPSPLARPLKTTNYNLQVISNAGCVAEKTIQVKAFNEIYIPNSFIPTGNVLNRIFKIPSGTSLNLEYLTVYDRYGNKIFSTANINSGWDGTYKGVKCPQGTYVYIIKGNDHRGAVFLKGTVILIR